MVTVINPTPNNSQSSDGGGMGFLVGAIVLVLFGVLFFIYGLPMIRDAMSDGVQVNVNPDDIKVNMEQPQSTQ